MDFLNIGFVRGKIKYDYLGSDIIDHFLGKLVYGTSEKEIEEEFRMYWRALPDQPEMKFMH